MQKSVHLPTWGPQLMLVYLLGVVDNSFNFCGAWDRDGRCILADAVAITMFPHIEPRELPTGYDTHPTCALTSLVAMGHSECQTRP